ATLRPSELTMPKALLDAIPPRPPGFGMHRELFARTTGDTFDPITPGAIAADVTIGFVLQTDRAARMVAQHAIDASLPGLEDVIDTLIKATFDAATSNPYEAEVRRAEERVLVDRLMWLAEAASMPQVRAIASAKLSRVAPAGVGGGSTATVGEAAHRALLAADIRRFLERPAADGARLMPTPGAPPGAPTGDVGGEWLGRRPICGWSERR